MIYRSFSEIISRSKAGEYTPKQAIRKAKNAAATARQQENAAAGCV
jgi:hypothetical protein